MSLKSYWLDYRQIKFLRFNLEYLGSDDLKEELDDYIKEHERKHDGNYIINILSDSCFRELGELLLKYHIAPINYF